MGWKKFSKAYLTFTKKDRLAGFIVALLLMGIYLLPHFFAKPSEGLFIQPDSSLLAAMDSLKTRPKEYSNDESHPIVSYEYEPRRKATFSKGEIFNFDPNTITPEGWKRLGLPEKTIHTIHNYRAKGGAFRNPEDLQKIWGLPAGFYEWVKDHIQIEAVPKKEFARYVTYPRYVKAERKIQTVNVNTDDTTAFIALPGIGTRLAYRITNFRDKLGGFYSADQIGETYGLPDSTFQKIKPYLVVNANSIKKININTATKEELKMHPYIRWKIANAIVEYRTQHGAFKAIEELKNIVLIDEAAYNKISHYVALH